MGKGINQVHLKGLPEDLRYLARIAAGKNPGYIYFLVADDLGIVKIGASNRWKGHWPAVDKRIREVENGCPFVRFTRKIVMLASVLGKTEKQLHRHFDRYNIDGEWFINDGSLSELIESMHRMEVIISSGKFTEEYYREKPWKMLESPAAPPSRRFAGLKTLYC